MSPSSIDAKPTALERREARPTLLLLAGVMFLPMGTCGGIGTWKAMQSRSSFMPTEAERLPATADAFRPARLTPEHCVFLTGITAGRAMFLGVLTNDVPQRVEIWPVRGGHDYRELHARVRVSEVYAHPLGPLPHPLAKVHATLGATLERAVAAVRS